jgi:hypothetical protein
LPIVAADIQFKLSGGAANVDPLNSLGGAISTAGGGVIVDNTLNNLFPNVTGPQSSSGSTHFRCIYLFNNHATLTFTNAKIWIAQLTASGDDEVDIGLDPAAIGSDSAINVTETPTGTSAPGGVTFSRPITEGGAITVGDIPAQSKKAFWVKRTVNAGANAYTNNSFQIQASGETLA